MTALIAYLTFAVVATAGRMWLHRRRTGDSGARLQASGRLRDAIAPGLLLASVVLLPLSAALVLGGRVARWSWGDDVRVAVAGWTLFAAGSALTLVAQYQMGAAWRIGQDAREHTELVTRGLFGWVRNPIYTGIALVGVGFLLLAPSAPAAIALLLGWLGLELQVRAVEEPLLEARHGPAYRAYAARVGRFVPGIGRRSA